MKRYALLTVLLLLLISGVSAAENVEIHETDAFSYTVSDDYTIYQISVNNVQPGITNLSFDSYGEAYYIDINCTQNWGWWIFDVDVTLPNLTVSSYELSTLQPFATDYDIKVQYTDSEFDTILDIDLCVDFAPDVSFQTPAYELATWDHVYFSSVSGTMPNQADIEIYLANEDDVQDIENDNVWAQFVRSAKNMGTDLFSWTWEGICVFVSAIPFVGEYFLLILDVFASIISELYWYFNLFVLEEPEITLCIIECFILAHAIIEGRTLMKMLKILYTDHIQLINGAIKFAHIMFDIIMRVIDVVTKIVNAIKPV